MSCIKINQFNNSLKFNVQSWAHWLAIDSSNVYRLLMHTSFMKFQKIFNNRLLWLKRNSSTLQCTTCGVNLTVKHVKEYDLSLCINTYDVGISRMVSGRKLVLVDTLWCQKYYERKN